MSRLEHLRAELDHHGFEALLISRRENVRYLSGFTGTAGVLLVSRDRSALFTDFRYVEQAQEQAPEWELIRWQEPLFDWVARYAKSIDLSELGYESHALTVAEHARLQEKVDAGLKPASKVVEGLRAVKDEAEVEAIRRAAELADAGLAHVTSLVRPGVTERELALEFEFFVRRAGAESLAFETIVAAGEHSSMPHAVTADKVLMPGDLLVFDCGARYHGYHSDMTRTFVVGSATDEQSNLYQAVLEAQRRGLEAVRPGAATREVDAVARDFLAERGWGEAFGHGLGHGVGLEIHESPRLHSSSDEVLKAGMVVTVEPGVYLPGSGGVRIEDLIVVREEGAEVLSRSPKDSLQ